MRKILITESQAKLLGIKEGEGDESGMKSASSVLGSAPKYLKIFAEQVPTKGDPTKTEPALKIEKLAEIIMKLITRQDPSNTIKFFDATGKFVGNVSATKLLFIKRDLKGIDTSRALNPNVDLTKMITGVKGKGRSLETFENGITIDTASKSLVKLSESQYKRLLAKGFVTEAKIIKEGDDTVKADDELKKETLELIKYLYRKSDEFSPFWEKHGLTYETLCDMLEKKGVIVGKNGKHELSKSLGNPQEAVAALETQLRAIVGSDAKPEAKKEIEEVGDYPAGAQDHPNAPMYDKREKQNPKGRFNILAYNPEIAILKGPDGLYYFYHFELKPEELGVMSRKNIDKEVLQNYINGHQEDIIKIDDNFKADLMDVYDKDPQIVSALSATPSLGETSDFEKTHQMMSKPIVNARTEKPSQTAETPEQKQKRIAAKIAQIRQKELELRKKEGGVEETTGAGSSGAFTAPMGVIDKKMPIDSNEMNVPVVGETEKLGHGYTHFAVQKSDNKIVNGWDYSSLFDKDDNRFDTNSVLEYAKGDLKDMFPTRKLSDFKIVTTNALRGKQIDPADSNNWLKDEIQETTAGSGSMGAYDTNALPNINRDGSFKEGKKTKAETKTQYAGGGFVKLGGCTKYNNGKGAQNGGCSQGAIDNVVKVSKTSGNINAPSLGKG